MPSRTNARALVLLGLRCSGKTTVGRLLASRLSIPFIDLDERTLARLRADIAAAAGATTIAHAWALAGQQAFREAEARALAEELRALPASGPRALALGGGTPTAPGAADLLQEAAARAEIAIVYLRADAETLRARMLEERARHPHDSGDPQRPGVTGADAIEEIPALLAQRDPLYAALASFIVDASRDPESLARELAALLTPP